MRETLPTSTSTTGQASRGSEQDSTSLSLRGRFFTPQTAVSFGVAFGVLWFLLTRLDIDVAALWSQVRSAHLGWLLLAYVVFYASLPMRAVRWRVLLHNADNADDPIRHQLPNAVGMTEIITLSWFANCVVPAKLGDAYRAYLLRKDAGGSFSRTLGTILAERALDLTTVVGLLGLAVVLSWRQTQGEGGMAFVEAGGVMVLLTIGSLLGMRFLAPAVGRLVPSRFRAPFYRLVEGLMGSWGQLPLVVVLSLLVWSLEISRLYFVVVSLGIAVPLSIVLLVALANSLLTTVPLTPGGLGAVEAGIIGLLVGVGGMGDEQAVAIALLDRTVSYWSLIVVGLLLFGFTRRR